MTKFFFDGYDAVTHPRHEEGFDLKLEAWISSFSYKLLFTLCFLRQTKKRDERAREFVKVI